MQQLGPKAGEDHTVLPPLETWQPHESRAWAMRFINDDSTEDYHGFCTEFRNQFPYLFSNGVDTYFPASVDDYLRRAPGGRRLDLDHELMALEMSDEQRKKNLEARNSMLNAKRDALIEARAKRAEDGAEARVEAGVAICGKTGLKNVGSHEARCMACDDARIALENN